MRAKAIRLTALLSILALAALNTASADETNDQISVLVAGDAIISLPWSHLSDLSFIQLIEEIRSADAAVLNLETLIHSYQGYPQAESGGTWMASEPRIAGELAWAGFDMAGLANNHTFDYGAIGVIENMENLRKAGIVYAGAGMDLQQARRPAYFETGTAKIALLSTASSFVSFGRAGRSRPDLHGRPGLNPLTVRKKDLTSKLLWNQWAYFAGVDYYDVNEADRDANLAAIRETSKHADLVIMSIHAHQEAPGSKQHIPWFLQDFARNCIDNGADIFFAHGPHIPRGIEIYKGRPIFYSLGNFVLQQEMMQKQPAEFYAKRDLGDAATLADVYGTGLPREKYQYESFVAKISFANNALQRIELIPISLQMHQPKGIRGTPMVATGEQGKNIIEKLADISEPFNTKITYEGDYGVVQIK